MLIRAVILLIVVSVTPFQLNGLVAQEHADPTHIIYKVDDGLPSMFISDIFQANDGLIWIATDHGVCTFDGRSFKSISNDSFQDHLVICISQDPRGQIWCITYDSKLYRLEGEQWRPHPMNDSLNKDDRFIPPRPRIEFNEDSIFVQLSGLSCVVTDSVALDIQDEETGYIGYLRQFGNSLFGRLKFKPSNIKDTVILIRAKKYTRTLSRFNKNHAKGGVVYTDISNELMAIGKSNVFQCFNEEQSVFGKIESNITNCFFFDHNNTLWIGSEKNGVYAFNSSSPDSMINYFHKKKITAGIQDINGGYWFGTFNEGLIYSPQIDCKTLPVNKAIGSEYKFIFHEGKIGLLGNSGYAGKSISSNLDDYQDLNWPDFDKIRFGFHTNRSGILGSFIVDPNNLRYVTYFNVNDFSHQVIAHKHSVLNQAILLENDTFFLGTYSGATGSDANKIKLRKAHFTKDIYSGGREVIHIAGDTFIIIHQIGFSTCILQDRSRGNQQILETYFDSISFSHAVPWRDKFILLSNASKPLLFDAKSGVASPIHELPIISANCFKSINPNEYFIGSEKGLKGIWYNENSKKWFLNNLTSNLGLPMSNITDISISNELIYMASTGQVQTIPIETVRNSRTVSSQIGIKRFSVDEQEIAMHSGFSIYTGSHVKFDIQIINFKLRQAASYFYRLLPNDSSWVESTEQSITYAALPPGSYTLQLNGGDEIVAHSFEILEHFYNKTWFIILYIGTGLLLIVLPFYMQLHYRVQQNRLEQERDNLKLQSLTNQLKPHFVFNALASIQSFILKNDPLESSEYLAKFSTYIRNALTFSKGDKIALSQAIASLRNYLELEQLRLRDAFDFTITIDDEIEANSVHIPVMLIQPYVENSVVHGMASIEYRGRIEIEFTKSSDRLIRCTIRDNGPGFSHSKTHHADRESMGVGTTINEERMKLINQLQKDAYKVQMRDNDSNSGAIVTIHIPI